MGDSSLEIIRRVGSGEISIEDGARRLEALESGAEAEGVIDQAEYRQPNTHFEQGQDDVGLEPGWWYWGWQVLFWTGMGIFTLGAVLMGWAYASNENFWFFCSWLPMLFGVLVLLLGWWSRVARWVHVRVTEAGGKRIAISMPLPLSLTSWLLRIFGRWIPAIHEKHLDDLPVVLDALRQAEGPISVDVDDKNGDKVKVYIL